MKAYIAMLPEMKRGQTEAQRLAQADALLKAQGFEGGVDDLLSGNISQQQPSTVQPRAEQQVAGDRYFAESPVKDVIDMMAKDGRITEENLPQYKALSSVVDQAVGPQFERAEQVMTVTMAELASMKKQMRDLQWKGLSEKVTKGLNRKEVDALLDRGLFKDYEAAVNYHMFNHPDRLKALQENAENRGQETGRKKLRRNKAIRKAKQSAQKAKQWDYKPYLNDYGALDDGKLNALPLADQVAMLEAFEKEQS